MTPIPCRCTLNDGPKVIEAYIVNFLTCNNVACAVVVLSAFDRGTVHCLHLSQIRVGEEWTRS